MPVRLSYAEKLKDPRWQKKRLAVLEHADFKCQLCGNARETLHVHHSYYAKGKMPWQYPTGSLIAVCETHHSLLHDLLKGLLSRRMPDPVIVVSPPSPPLIYTGDKSNSPFAKLRRQVEESIAAKERGK